MVDLKESIQNVFASAQQFLHYIFKFLKSIYGGGVYYLFIAIFMHINEN